MALAREAARKYDEVRWTIIDECLKGVSLNREEVVPRFASGELEQLKEGVRLLMAQGEDGAEFASAVKRAEAARLPHEALVEGKNERTRPTHLTRAVFDSV